MPPSRHVLLVVALQNWFCVCCLSALTVCSSRRESVHSSSPMRVLTTFMVPAVCVNFTAKKKTSKEPCGRALVQNAPDVSPCTTQLVGLVRKSGPRGDKHSSGGAARGSSQASGGSRDARSSTSSNPASSRHPSFVGDIGDPEMTIQEETVAKIAAAPAETVRGPCSIALNPTRPRPRHVPTRGGI